MTTAELITSVDTNDALVAKDQQTLTADQATDAAAHADLVSDLKTNGGALVPNADRTMGTLYLLDASGNVTKQSFRFADAPVAPSGPAA